MPFTINKGLSVQATGSNSGTWGSDGTTPTANSSTALNQGAIQLLDQALGGTTTLSLSATTPIALTQLQTQNGMLRIAGTLLANIVVSPDSGVLMVGQYNWENVTTGSFTVTLTNSAGSVVLPQSRRGELWIDTVNGPRITAISGTTAPDSLPVGTAITFFNTTVPAGWTINVTYSDRALRLSNTTGGTVGGTTAFTTVFSARTIAQANLPNVNFTVTDSKIYRFATANSAAGSDTTNAVAAATGTTNNTPACSSSGSIVVNSGGSGTALDFEVTYATVIIGTRGA